jgi:hypothetical protein
MLIKRFVCKQMYERWNRTDGEMRNWNPGPWIMSFPDGTRFTAARIVKKYYRNFGRKLDYRSLMKCLSVLFNRNFSGNNSLWSNVWYDLFRLYFLSDNYYNRNVPINLASNAFVPTKAPQTVSALAKTVCFLLVGKSPKPSERTCSVRLRVLPDAFIFAVEKTCVFSFGFWPIMRPWQCQIYLIR